MKNLLFINLCWITLSLLGLTNTFAQTIESFPCIDRTFQVVVHFSQEPDGTLPTEMNDLQDAFDSVNQIFDPICVKFLICETRVMDNFHFDHVDGDANSREGLEMRNTNQELSRINLYYVRELTGTEFAATYQGINQIDSSMIILHHTDSGVVPITQLVHEMGMFFGLRHTHDEQLGEEHVLRNNCLIAGDEICDTPADPAVSTCSPSPPDCNTICAIIGDVALKDDEGTKYAPDFSNFMSNYGACRTRFTRQQYLRMAETYLNGPKDQW